MSCRTVSELMSLELDARLSEEEERLLQAHLADCEACRMEREMMRRASSLLAGTPWVAPPTTLSARVMTRVRRRRLWLRLVRGASLGVLALAILAALFLPPLLALTGPEAADATTVSASAGLLSALARAADLACIMLRAVNVAAGAILPGSGWAIAALYLALSVLLICAWVYAISGRGLSPLRRRSL